jgi:hypothetical protein
MIETEEISGVKNLLGLVLSLDWHVSVPQYLLSLSQSEFCLSCSPHWIIIFQCHFICFRIPEPEIHNVVINSTSVYPYEYETIKVVRVVNTEIIILWAEMPCNLIDLQEFVSSIFMLGIQKNSMPFSPQANYTN